MLKFQHGLLFVMKRLMWSYRHNPMSEKTEGAAKPRKVGLLHGAADDNGKGEQRMHERASLQ